jgi:hypothetical protein
MNEGRKKAFLMLLALRVVVVHRCRDRSRGIYIGIIT